MIEEWKDIVGYEGLYQISSFGEVKRVSRKSIDSLGRETLYPTLILKPKTTEFGYKSITLYKDKKCKTHFAHRLVMISFKGLEELKPQVNHKDGNKLNNRLNNLEWVTRSENIKHSLETLNRKTNLGIRFNKVKLDLCQQLAIATCLNYTKKAVKRYSWM